MSTGINSSPASHLLISHRYSPLNPLNSRLIIPIIILGLKIAIVYLCTTTL